MPFSILTNEVQILALMSVRILVIISFTPVVSSSQAPFFIRVVLAVIFAYIVRTSFGQDNLLPPSDLWSFMVLLVGEAIIGAIMGFYIHMLFLLLGVITEYFSTLMGLRAAQVLNPFTGDSSAIVSQFFNIIVMMVFLSSYTLQRIFYSGIASSFYVLNAQSIFQHQDQSYILVLLYGFARLFERTFIIALPIFVTLLIVNVGLGLFGKIAPQMNLLVLGLPIQILLGLVFLYIFLPTMINVIDAIFDDVIHVLTRIIKRLMVVT